MTALAADLGFSLPASVDPAPAGAALAIFVTLAVVGWFAGRFAGARTAEFLEKKCGLPGEGLLARACAVIRYLIVALGAEVALRLYAWPMPGVWLLGLAGAVAAALLAKNVMRGLHLPRWSAWLLAVFIFVALLADAVGGLKPLTAELGRIGFTIGSRSITILSLIQIVISLITLYAVMRLVNRMISQSIRGSRGLDPTQQALGEKLATIIIVTIAFFLAIDLAGIDLTALAFFSGGFGLAVGFGLQKTLGNLIAGIILLMDRSIKPGDVISVGESFGSVNKIGVRAVSIVTRDGKEYLIPNELLMTQEVVNWSYSTRDVRISIPVGIGYDCNVAEVHDLMIEAANASPRVLDSPHPAVWITALGESSIQHEIRVWIRDPEAGLGSVRSDILTRLLALFKEKGIHMPAPQRDIRVREWPEGGILTPTK